MSGCAASRKVTRQYIARFTDQQIEEFIKGWNNRVKLAALAYDLGITPNMAVRLRYSLGLPSRQGGKIKTESFMFLVPTDRYEAMRKRAAENRQSMSAYLNGLIKKDLEGG